mgnify:FL=1
MLGGLTGAAFGAIGGYGRYNNWGTVSFTAAHAAGGCVTSVASGGGARGRWPPGATMSIRFEGDGATIFNGIKAIAVGGTASVLGGGKFRSGATTAAYAYLFNELSQAARERLISAGAAAGGVGGGAVALGCGTATGGACALGGLH